VNGVIAPAGNLPVALTSFVGRRSEIAGIRRLLGTVRLLTLTGVGGLGKTRLALESAGLSRRAFADGVWLVDLAAVQDPSAVASTVARALGLPDQGPRWPAARGPGVVRLRPGPARHVGVAAGAA